MSMLIYEDICVLVDMYYQSHTEADIRCKMHGLLHLMSSDLSQLITCILLTQIKRGSMLSTCSRQFSQLIELQSIRVSGSIPLVY